MTVYQYDLLLNENNIPQLKVVNEYMMANAKAFCTPERIVSFMKNNLDLDKKAEEYVYLLCFNNVLMPLGIFEIAHGTVNQSLLGLREIMIRVLACGATAIALVHNHPSGRLNLSNEDKLINQRMNEVCNLMGISYLDFIIIGGNKYYSTKEAET